MRKPETAEEIRRRERRLIRREKQTRISVRRKTDRAKAAVCREKTQKSIVKLLKDDKQKDKPDKKLELGTFLRAFSYIGFTPYDKRHMIPSSSRRRSFNERRQYLDFFREFIYPYKVPPLLMWAAFEKETVVTERGNTRPSPDIESIRSAKKWVCDIVSGDSFYKRNKGLFTRAESHFFLNSEIAYNGPNSVIELVFYSRCMARKMGIRQSRAIGKTFAQKFGRYWNHPTVIGFLDLIARSNSYSDDNGGLDNVCDFVLSKIEKHKGKGRKPPFSFGKRTMASVIALSNEWHIDFLREQEALIALNRTRQIANRQIEKAEYVGISSWYGISIGRSEIEDDSLIWSFTQLCDTRSLLNEGKIMKNCISSYSIRCASGDSAIFHVSRVFKEDEVIENIATLEVTRGRVLIQAKGKCNARLSGAIWSIIKKWAQLNRIKVNPGL